jgi:hypothetical protein
MKQIVFAIGMLMMFFTSCSNEDVNNNTSNALPDAQLCITSLTSTPIQSTRNGENKGERVEFYDVITDKSYSFDIITLSEDKYRIEYGDIDNSYMDLTVKGNSILTNFMGEGEEEVTIDAEHWNNYVIYTINPLNETRGYRHLSWYECVKKIALNENLALAYIFVPSLGAYVAGTASIICLYDERLRWEEE